MSRSPKNMQWHWQRLVMQRRELLANILAATKRDNDPRLSAVGDSEDKVVLALTSSAWQLPARLRIVSSRVATLRIDIPGRIKRRNTAPSLHLAVVNVIMPSPMVMATLQATTLSAASNVVAQIGKSYSTKVSDYIEMM